VIGRMNHFKHSVGAPLHATEAYPTRQSQIQRFTKEVRYKELKLVYFNTGRLFTDL